MGINNQEGHIESRYRYLVIGHTLKQITFLPSIYFYKTNKERELVEDDFFNSFNVF